MAGRRGCARNGLQRLRVLDESGARRFPMGTVESCAADSPVPRTTSRRSATGQTRRQPCRTHVLLVRSAKGSVGRVAHLRAVPRPPADLPESGRGTSPGPTSARTLLDARLQNLLSDSTKALHHGIVRPAALVRPTEQTNGAAGAPSGERVADRSARGWPRHGSNGFGHGRPELQSAPRHASGSWSRRLHPPPCGSARAPSRTCRTVRERRERFPSVRSGGMSVEGTSRPVLPHARPSRERSSQIVVKSFATADQSRGSKDAAMCRAISQEPLCWSHHRSL